MMIHIKHETLFLSPFVCASMTMLLVQIVRFFPFKCLRTHTSPVIAMISLSQYYIIVTVADKCETESLDISSVQFADSWNFLITSLLDKLLSQLPHLKRLIVFVYEKTKP